MTGYGKCVTEFNGKKIHAEIKSLNSKALDLSSRIAPLYREKEMEIRTYITSNLERGKIDFNLWIEKEDGASATPINKTIVNEYYKQIKSICSETGIPEPIEWMSTLLRMPDAISKAEAEELSEEEWAAAKSAVEGAVGQLMEFNLLAMIEPYEKERTEKIKQRIVEALEKTLEVDYDKNRLEQEMIYYIEKLDISEEKQRLTNHLKYFLETMADGHGQGKKLGFIAQEMGREINTTGSKSNNAEMQNIVVKMKDELEQIKEQVLNVL